MKYIQARAAHAARKVVAEEGHGDLLLHVRCRLCHEPKIGGDAPYQLSSTKSDYASVQLPYRTRVKPISLRHSRGLTECFLDYRRA